MTHHVEMRQDVLWTLTHASFSLHCTLTILSSQVVGAANAVAAGWGNLGGGFIQLVMPVVFELIAGPIGMAQFTAWRLSFLLPALIQGCMALAVVFLGQVRRGRRVRGGGGAGEGRLNPNSCHH